MENVETQASNTMQDLISRLDVLSADGIFILKKLQSLKTQEELNTIEAEYQKILSNLSNLHQDFLEHAKAKTTTFKVARRRINYLLIHIRQAYNNSSRRLLREIKLQTRVTQAGHTVLNAKLLAKFLVEEAVKLNAPLIAKGDKDDLRVSRVDLKEQPTAMSLAEILGTSKTEGELLEGAIENPLEGMNDVL